MPGPSLALLGVVRFRQPGGALVIGTYAFVVAVWAIVALRPGAAGAPSAPAPSTAGGCG